MTSADGHRLAHLDQVAFELMRATGRHQLMQCIWVYEEPIDVDAIRRFHRIGQVSTATRVIERSPLPFGRPRWVRPRVAPLLLIGDRPRARAELVEWADEMAHVPLDPERGPSWLVAVQPFTDGSTAVCLVGSHIIMDGVGDIMAMCEAITDSITPHDYARARDRGWLTGLASDLLDAARGLPAAMRSLRRVLPQASRTKSTAPQSDSRSESIRLPWAIIDVDANAWDRRARELGGSTFSLVAAYAARVAYRMDRTRPATGEATLVMAVNERESLADDRALAMGFSTVVIDPTSVATDLGPVRAEMLRARKELKRQGAEAMAFLPLVPWLSRRRVRRATESLFDYSQGLPTSCSNLGDLPADLNRIAGRDAQGLVVRAVDVCVTESELARAHGHLVVVSSRANGRISLAVESWQPGSDNSDHHVRDMALAALQDLGLDGEAW